MKLNDMTRKYIITKIEELLENKIDSGEVEHYKVQGAKIYIEGYLDSNTVSMLGLYLRKLEKLEAEALKELVNMARDDIKHGRTKPMRSFREELEEKVK